MSALLIKLFVKDSKNTIDSKVRGAYIHLAVLVGIICNLVLFGAKLTLGIISGSLAVIADAFNNLSDMGTSIITLLGFKMASKPADKQHPFGHGRMEYMSGFIVSCLIMFVGIELFGSSIGRIKAPVEINMSTVSIVVLLLSILLKLWMGLFSRKIGQSIQSTALTATGLDNLLDVISTSAVLVSSLISNYTHVSTDGPVGLVVSLIILFSGVRVAKETLNPLLGEAPGRETVRQLEQLVLSYDGIIGVHDIIIHSYGPGRCFACLHVEVPSTFDMMATHALVDECEREVRKKMGFELVIHVDPVETDNQKVEEAKELCVRIIQDFDPRFDIHDFRILENGSISDIFFDVEVHDAITLNDAELVSVLTERLNNVFPDARFILRIDRHYT